MRFSLMFFSSGEQGGATVTYNHLLDFARRADASSWTRVWLPERHFSDFGAVHPNPAVLGAAVAAQTRRIRIAAGSVVAPLHDPIRIAEEWAIVDNLSDGRVDLSLAAGWRAEDFALAPASYAERMNILAKSAVDVRRLWRGESLARKDGTGTTHSLRARPKPRQPELPLWITAARSSTSFELAGTL
ncbi:MAG: LLM class flavin-dependent oxidoreductase, partial [Myxococcales bacterium]|nr:LLM class flavin-dependent oxidoreductase [Myxococcales bacterium]